MRVSKKQRVDYMSDTFRYSKQWWVEHYSDLSASFLYEFLGFRIPNRQKVVKRIAFVQRSLMAEQMGITAHFPYPDTDDPYGAAAMQYGMSMQSTAITHYLRLTRRCSETLPLLDGEHRERDNPSSTMLSILFDTDRFTKVERIVRTETYNDKHQEENSVYRTKLRFRAMQRVKLMQMKSYDSLVGEQRTERVLVSIGGSPAMHKKQPGRDIMRAAIDHYNKSPYVSASPVGMLLDPDGNESLLAIHCRYIPRNMEHSDGQAGLVLMETGDSVPKMIEPQLHYWLQAIVQLCLTVGIGDATVPVPREQPRSIDMVLWGSKWMHVWRLERDHQLDQDLQTLMELLAEPMLQWGDTKISIQRIAGGRPTTTLPGLRVDVYASISEQLQIVLNRGMRVRTVEAGEGGYLRWVWRPPDNSPVPSGTAQLQATMFRNTFSTQDAPGKINDGNLVWPSLKSSQQRRPAAYGFRRHTAACANVAPQGRYRAVLHDYALMDYPYNAFEGFEGFA